MLKKETKNSLDTLFYPKSIAIIGASNNTDKIGGYIFSQIKDLKDIQPYPINPKSDSIQEIKAYKSITKLKNKIDLAIIVIPGKFVMDSLKECIKANVKNVIIISAGFKETGEEGAKKEEEIKKLVQKHNINLVGPNCLGILNAEIKMNCSFAKDIPNSGGTALVSQSGAVIDAIIDWSFKNNIGFSKIMSVGNMAGVDELEILKYLKDDKKTKSVVFYMETLEKGKEFAEILKEISKKKKVIIIKPGSSENAKKAIGSHTGSLAQDNILVKTLIENSGGILVDDLSELFNLLIALKANTPKAENTVLLTNAGGVGVISTDMLEKSDFKLYEMTKTDKNQLKFLPSEASINNPIDILGDAKSDRYIQTLEKLEKNLKIDNILILLTPQIMTDSKNIAEYIAKFTKKSNKTIYSCFLGEKEVKEGIEVFNKNNFANFQTPHEAIKAMNALYKNHKLIQKNKQKSKLKTFEPDKKELQKIKKLLKKEDGLLDYEMSKKVLNLFNIDLPQKIILSHKDDIPKTRLKRNQNYVLKVDAKEIIHKKDIGGVELGINTENFTKRAFDLFEKIQKISKDFTITIEEETKGIEIFVGLKSDKDLGNFLLFGWGGTYVNLLNDIQITTTSLTLQDAQTLVNKTKISKLLEGYRGDKKTNTSKLYKLLTQISQIQNFLPELKEVDFNPIICTDKDCYLVDVKLVCKHS